MKIKELREKKGPELVALEVNLRRDLAEARLKVRLGSETKTARLSGMRKDIARVLTLLKEGQ